MTKKDYIAIAACIAETRMKWEVEGESDNAANIPTSVLVGNLVRVFAADNPRFDRARFLRACGL